MLLAKRRARSGFTLVELLVTITILASLMGMTSVAIWKAMQSAREAKIAVEVTQLAQAMQGYKEKHGEYPPAMNNALIANRKVAFMRHLQIAYPNCAYGVAASSFDSLRNTIRSVSSTNAYNAALYSDGAITGQIPLDLYTLDSAEALVFWLGGFPVTVNGSNQPIAGRKLIGFHKDADQPFKLEQTTAMLNDPLSYRTSADSFQFDQTRLVDNDQDGWLEYIPVRPTSGQLTAPFVYFDSGTYGRSGNSTAGFLHMGYPRTESGIDNAYNTQMLTQYGRAMPMALRVAGNAIHWANPSGFQIIAAGADGAYNDPSITSVYRVPTFPNPDARNGEVYIAGGSTTGSLTQFELDNLNNLSGKTLEGARAEAQR